MQATQTRPAAERYKHYKTFKELGAAFGCSEKMFYLLKDLGLLSCIQGPKGFASTEELVLEAFEKRAKAKQAKRGAKPEAATEKTTNQPTRKERADRAAQAAFGCRAGGGEG